MTSAVGPKVFQAIIVPLRYALDQVDASLILFLHQCGLL